MYVHVHRRRTGSTTRRRSSTSKVISELLFFLRQFGLVLRASNLIGVLLAVVCGVRFGFHCGVGVGFSNLAVCLCVNVYRECPLCS